MKNEALLPDFEQHLIAEGLSKKSTHSYAKCVE